MANAGMIKDLVCFMQDRIACMELYQSVHGLARQLTDGDGKMYPGIYSGNGKYRPLEYSQVSGMVYFRKNGDVTSEDLEPDVPCDRIAEYSIPLKLISFVRSDKLGLDDIYNDDRIAQSLDNAITARGLKTAIGAKAASVKVESYSNDRVRIIEEEYSGQEFKDLHYSYSYLSMNLVAKIKTDKACITDLCYGEDYSYGGSTFICPVIDEEKEITKYTNAGQSTYIIPALNGKTIKYIQFGQVSLAPDQYSLVGSNLTFLDSGHGFPDISFPIEPNIYFYIRYR